MATATAVLYDVLACATSAVMTQVQELLWTHSAQLCIVAQIPQCDAVKHIVVSRLWICFHQASPSAVDGLR